MSKVFTVFGLQRSGTNFLENSIRLNLSNVKIVNTFKSGGLWKHSFNLEGNDYHINPRGKLHYGIHAVEKLNNTNAIYLHKNPFTWIESIIRSPADIRVTYPKCRQIRDDNDVMHNGWNISYLADLWKQHTEYWLSKNVYRVRYESLISSENEIFEELEKISKHFNCSLNTTKIRGNGVNGFDETKRQRLINFVAPTFNNDVLRQEVTKRVTTDLLSKLGYDSIVPQKNVTAEKVLPRENAKKVLLVASGFSARQYSEYDWKGNGWTIVAINNGWQAVRGDWNWWIRPGDYKGKRPEGNELCGETISRYTTEVNKFGGQNECGYSITLTAGYWSLANIKPGVLAYLGADMNYTPDKEGNTHIYGKGYDIQKNGKSDPDRMAQKYKGNKTEEEYLNYIYKRLEEKAMEKNCVVYNVSHTIDTRLPWKRVKPYDIK